MKRFGVVFALIVLLSVPVVVAAQYGYPSGGGSRGGGIQVGGGGYPSGGDSGGEGDVTIVDFAYQPPAMFVSPGETVTWYNAGAAPHTVDANAGAFDVGHHQSRWVATARRSRPEASTPITVIFTRTCVGSWPSLARKLRVGSLRAIAGGKAMRRTRVAFVVALLLAASAIVNRGWSPVRAQEATPAAGPIAVIELAPGVTAEVFAGAPSARAPEQTVYLARFVFQPGAEIFPHSHPGTTVLGVAVGLLRLDACWRARPTSCAGRRPARTGPSRMSPSRAPT